MQVRGMTKARRRDGAGPAVRTLRQGHEDSGVVKGSAFMSDMLVLSVSDPTELLSLCEWLAEVPSVQLRREADTPAAGELGALEYVAVLASSGGLIAAIRVLPEFLRARRPELKIRMKSGDKEFAIDATNIDDVLPVLEKLIDAG
jgi:hypothetical protein